MGTQESEIIFTQDWSGDNACPTPIIEFSYL